MIKKLTYNTYVKGKQNGIKTHKHLKINKMQRKKRQTKEP
jgi:hypothetical protein